MVRDRLRALVRGIARRVTHAEPRIPGGRPTARTPPTRRSAWTPPVPPVEDAPPPDTVAPSEAPTELELPAAEVLRRMAEGEDIVVVDVREASELWGGHARNAVLVPMSQLQSLASSLPNGPLIALYCAAGVRSYGAADFLRQQGRANAWSIPEGFSGWIEAQGPWLQPATTTDWRLLQPVRLTAAAAEARGLHPVPAGQVQSIESTDDGVALCIRTRTGQWISGLGPADLERIGRR